MFNNKNKEIWKIQPSKENTINIKRKSNLIGKLYEFSYKNKTDFYLSLEQDMNYKDLAASILWILLISKQP